MFELKYQESADSLIGGKKLCIHFSVSGTENTQPTVYTGVVKETVLSPLLSVPQVYCGNVNHTGGLVSEKKNISFWYHWCAMCYGGRIKILNVFLIFTLYAVVHG